MTMLYKPFCVALLLAGLFGLIWLRSGIVSTTYNLRELEEKTMAAKRDMKMLMAERANLMAVAKVTASLNSGSGEAPTIAEGGYVTPTRTKVVHVRRNTEAAASAASYSTGDRR
jgi:hypothetical protein